MIIATFICSGYIFAKTNRANEIVYIDGKDTIVFNASNNIVISLSQKMYRNYCYGNDYIKGFLHEFIRSESAWKFQLKIEEMYKYSDEMLYAYLRLYYVYGTDIFAAWHLTQAEGDVILNASREYEKAKERRKNESEYIRQQEDYNSSLVGKPLYDEYISRNAKFQIVNMNALEASLKVSIQKNKPFGKKMLAGNLENFFVTINPDKTYKLSAAADDIREKYGWFPEIVVESVCEKNYNLLGQQVKTTSIIEVTILDKIEVEYLAEVEVKWNKKENKTDILSFSRKVDGDFVRQKNLNDDEMAMLQNAFTVVDLSGYSKKKYRISFPVNRHSISISFKGNTETESYTFLSIELPKFLLK